MKRYRKTIGRVREVLAYIVKDENLLPAAALFLEFQLSSLPVTDTKVHIVHYYCDFLQKDSNACVLYHLEF